MAISLGRLTLFSDKPIWWYMMIYDDIFFGFYQSVQTVFVWLKGVICKDSLFGGHAMFFWLDFCESRYEIEPRFAAFSSQTLQETRAPLPKYIKYIKIESSLLSFYTNSGLLSWPRIDLQCSKQNHNPSPSLPNLDVILNQPQFKSAVLGSPPTFWRIQVSLDSEKLSFSGKVGTLSTVGKLGVPKWSTLTRRDDDHWDLGVPNFESHPMCHNESHVWGSISMGQPADGPAVAGHGQHGQCPMVSLEILGASLEHPWSIQHETWFLRRGDWLPVAHVGFTVMRI